MHIFNGARVLFFAWIGISPYGVAAVSRIDKIIGLFCRISSLLWVSFAKETYDLIDPTSQSHPVCIGRSLHIWIRFAFAEYRLFYRSLLQKRRIILSILPTKATPYALAFLYMTYTTILFAFALPGVQVCYLLHCIHWSLLQKRPIKETIFCKCVLPGVQVLHYQGCKCVICCIAYIGIFT